METENLYRDSNGLLIFWGTVNDIPDEYVLVEWPFSQDYMEEPWFEEEAALFMGPELESGEISGSSYLIPKEHYKPVVL